MRPSKNTSAAQEKDGFWATYADYSRTLRAWLVAYGVGGPVLFISNERISSAIAASGCARRIVVLFLFGVGLQVVLAFLNKWGAWHLYAGEGDKKFRKRRSFAFWAWVSDQAWLDILLDITSIVMFAWATTLVFNVFAVVPSAT